jgi:hypothetical protein
MSGLSIKLKENLTTKVRLAPLSQLALHFTLARAPAGAAEKTTQPRRMVSPFL